MRKKVFTRKAVFLDRDGVINEILFRNGLLSSPYRLKEVRIFPWAKEAVQSLRESNFPVIVVTNQPEVGRGLLGEESLREIHTYFQKSLGIDAVYYCPHERDDECKCKKPNIGMLEQAAQDFSISLERSFMIGDRWRDIAAGKSAGCTTIHIPSEATDADAKRGIKLPKPDFVANNLADAVKLIVV